MDQESIVTDIEQRAWRIGVSIDAVCRKAGVAPSTFSRWKPTEKNPEPISATLRSIGKMYDALALIESERPRPRRAKVAA